MTNTEVSVVDKGLHAPANVLDNTALMKQLKQIANEQKKVVDDLIDAITKGQSQKTIDSLDRLEAVGMSHSKLARFNSISLGQIFGVIKYKWKELPESFTQQYSDCYDYIQQRYGYGYQMVDMYATVWDAWFSGKFKYELPDYVKLTNLPVVKLRVTAPFVMRGEMEEKQWKALADETLSRSELSRMLRGIRRKLHPEKPRKKSEYSKRSHLICETGDLRMYVAGQIEIVGFLNMDSQNPLVQTEIKRILIMANISIRR